jgi:hypothetical protein
MGFFSGIGKAISNGVKSLTGGAGIGDLIKKGIGSLVEKFAPKIGDLLSKSPLANVVNKVIDFAAKNGPKMAESGGFLGMLGGLLNKVGGLGSLANIAQTLLQKLGGADMLSKFGLGNLTDIFAQRQAQMMAGNLAS